MSTGLYILNGSYVNKATFYNSQAFYRTNKATLKKRFNAHQEHRYFLFERKYNFQHHGHKQ